MSTKVLESSKGWASSIAFRISPWQYNGESQGAVTEPLSNKARAPDADTAARATIRRSDMLEKGNGRSSEGSKIVVSCDYPVG